MNCFAFVTDIPRIVLMGNSFGKLFRISSWGESHGGGIGVVIDGCPPRLPLDENDIQPFLIGVAPDKAR